MTLDYFYGQAGELFSFFRIPKALFQEQRFQDLSTDAKTLYGILLDRMSLSVKNEWFDKKGRVFIIFTIEDGYHPRRSARSWHRHNRPCERAFRPNWRETAARSSSLRRTLQAFLSKAAPVLRVRKGGYDYKHTAAPCKVPALP